MITLEFSGLNLASDGMEAGILLCTLHSRDLEHHASQQERCCCLLSEFQEFRKVVVKVYMKVLASEKFKFLRVYQTGAYSLDISNKEAETK